MTDPDWPIHIDFHEHGAVIALPIPFSRVEATARILGALGYDLVVADISARLGGMAVTTVAAADAWRKDLGL